MARAVKCVRTRSEPVILTLVLVIMTANAVGGKSTMKTEDVVHVERREGHDVHTVVKAVNQGRSSQFAFCRQAGNCIGRILICPSYCFTTSASREASPSSASLAQKDDYSDYNTDYNDYNYYYYYDYDYDYGGSPGGGRGGRGGSGGGFGGGNGGRGGFGGGPGSPGSPGGSGRGNVGRGGFGGSPGSPGAGPGGGQGGQGGGTRLGPGGRGPVGRGRGGSNGAVGSGNGCRYDCITSCRAFCAV